VSHKQSLLQTAPHQWGRCCGRGSAPPTPTHQNFCASGNETPEVLSVTCRLADTLTLRLRDWQVAWDLETCRRGTKHDWHCLGLRALALRHATGWLCTTNTPGADAGKRLSRKTLAEICEGEPLL
jgi:hypothetical protein